MNRKFVLASAGLLLVLLVSSCNNNQKQELSNREGRIPVRLQVVKKIQEPMIIPASGLFSTDDETTLAFKNGGIISHIWVKEGDAVQKGQLLASLNMTEMDAAVQQAKLAEEKAGRDYDRASTLYRDSVATLEQMQNAQTARGYARQQLRVAEFNRQFSEIRATENGYVLQRFVNEGQVAGAGTPVLRINGAGENDWVLKVGVSDSQWAHIRVGDKAFVETDVLPGKQLAACVFKKEKGIDPASGTFVVHLKLEDTATPNLASGLFAKAEIYASAGHGNTWAIPYNALLEANGSKGYVFVTNDRKTAEKQEVTIGAILQNRVLITRGLEQADYLIISGSPYLNDGSAIDVQ